jgi:hypothetical protein
MHACKITSPINNMNNYYITFNYLEEVDNSLKNKNDINELVNYIRLHYRINKISYIVEYDNIEYEIIKVVSTTITKRDTFSISDSDTFKLKILIWRFKNITDILFNKPTLFSEYTEMVNVLFSIVLT